MPSIFELDLYKKFLAKQDQLKMQHAGLREIRKHREQEEKVEADYE